MTLSSNFITASLLLIALHDSFITLHQSLTHSLDSIPLSYLSLSRLFHYTSASSSSQSHRVPSHSSPSIAPFSHPIARSPSLSTATARNPAARGA
uniref:Putative secreted protein n=1 Tax=Ixodes ricinus TaxID=34613 RepID=A0A6B0U5P1_IXORI